jgi:formate dehydrogenase iron-sulfur subunit
MSTAMELPTVDPAPRHPRWLVDQLLAEQQSLPAVERFSRWHESQGGPSELDRRRYEAAIPLTSPAAGEQFAFQVDLDACSGCKACVTACHSMNGLEAHETWRDVGVIIGVDVPVIQHITTACHHCLEPACLAGCPVKAYDKDPVTGIVRHLDDQCIGCQYCSLMCPYDVPKYSPLKGIVRKCDMCRQRLASGEAPACVQSCPNHAIRIVTVAKAEARASARGDRFLIGAPDPRLTLPTTQFISKRQQAFQARSGDEDCLQPAHGHLALVVMLVLTQLSVGTLFLERLLAAVSGPSFVLQALAFVVGSAGGTAALFHLGRPAGAWRAWIGWRTSWLSREILCFGGYSALLGLALAIQLGPDTSLLSVASWLLVYAAFAFGVAGVFCSAMIYAATGRGFWSIGRTGPKFALTALLTGTSGVAASGLFGLMIALPLIVAAKLAVEALCLRSGDSRRETLSRVARILGHPLEFKSRARWFWATCGGLVLPLLAAACHFDQPDRGVPVQFLAGLSFIACVVGELYERYLFFAAAGKSRMPGALST